MKTYGGFFELELFSGREYHCNGLRLNTGRNALEYILRASQFSKVFIPYFTCDVILEPIIRLGIQYEFYFVNEYLEPNFNYDSLSSREAFLYTNYFGLKDSFIDHLSSICHNLIIDNSQSFYSTPLSDVPTFYSARKFFGVPDGAYLYTHIFLKDGLDQDISSNRFDHLIKRIDISPETAYPLYKENEERLRNQPMLEMSKLSRRILSSINYSEVATKRRKNYSVLHEQLKDYNKIDLGQLEGQIPMVYPFLTDNSSLRNVLIEEGVYTPQFWPNVLDWTYPNSLEYRYANNMVYLPIDQRYNLDDMTILIQKVLKYS